MHSLAVLEHVGLLSKARVTQCARKWPFLLVHHLLVAKLVAAVGETNAALLAGIRLKAQMHGASVLVEIGALSEAAVAVQADVGPFLEMNGAHMLNGVVLLDETGVAQDALEWAFALAPVQHANVLLEVLTAAEG